MSADKARLASLLARAGAKPAALQQGSVAPPMALRDQIDNVAEWARLDPANASRLITMIGRDYITDMMAERRAEIGEAMPAIGEITAAQCSLFDNWGSSKRPNKNKGEKNASAPRYQVTMELWTTPTGTPLLNKVNSAFQATGALLDANALTKRLKQLHDAKGRPWRKRVEGDATGEQLEAFAGRLMQFHAQYPGKLWGPVFSTIGGTKYFLGHYVGCDAATIEGKPEVTLYHEGNGELTFTRFANRYPNNQPLGAYIVGHSRITSRADLSSWRTANIR